MPDPLGAPPGARLIDPAGHELLADFTCGGGTDYEREVDEIVASYHGGNRQPQLQFLAGVDSTSGDLIGVCAIFERDLPGIAAGAMYVGVIGIAERFRGRRLPNGSRIGDWLLHESLVRLQAAWINMPLVWALIDHANDPSQELFRRHQFEQLPEASKYAVFIRPAGVSAT